jgi:hypothetical protein
MYTVSVSYHITSEGGPENGYGDSFPSYEKPCYVEFNEDEDVMIEAAIDCAANMSHNLPEEEGYEIIFEPEDAEVYIDHDEKDILVSINVTYLYIVNNTNNNNQNGGKRVARKSRKSRKSRKTSRKSRKASRKSRKSRKVRKSHRK